MPDAPSPEKESRPWWVWLNVLGLDAVITALVWMPLFARVTNARLTLAEYVVLGCGVWCVYGLDRMTDGIMEGGPRRERHRFAARRWLPLGLGMLTAAGGSGWLLAFHVQEIVSLWGLRLLGGIGLYFVITWFSRRPWAGLVGACSFGGMIALGLMQGLSQEGLWPQVWRAALAGFIVTVLMLSLRKPGAPAPWTLPRKLMGGWLFAIGTSLAPHAHLEMWAELLFSAPVLLFGAVCALNSLGIRLWEDTARDFEQALLWQFYPWLLLTVAIGSGMEWSQGNDWTRPVFMACLLSSLLLLGLHRAGSRIPLGLRRSLADGVMIAAGLAMLAMI